MDYAGVALIGGVSGWALQRAQSGPVQHGLLLAGLYGAAAVGLFALTKELPNISIILLAAISLLVYVLIECGHGLLVEAPKHENGWIKSEGYKFCSNGNRVKASMIWFIFTLSWLWAKREIGKSKQSKRSRS